MVANIDTVELFVIVSLVCAFFLSFHPTIVQLTLLNLFSLFIYLFNISHSLFILDLHRLEKLATVFVKVEENSKVGTRKL